jgi:hypothetical protein
VYARIRRRSGTAWLDWFVVIVRFGEVLWRDVEAAVSI